MITHQIPIISSTAGELNDGSIIGKVNESLVAAVFSDKRLADNIYAMRKNISGTSFSFDDISAEAASEVPNSFLPFGTTAQMTAGDELYLACESALHEIYVDIDTPGNWAGTFEIRYSSNGTTANQTVPNLTDGSNGLRNADGVYRITFDMPTDIVPFSPVPGDIPSRTWVVLKPIVTSVTTAPQLRRIWLFHDDVKYNDFTAVQAGSLTVAPSANTFLPKIASTVLYAFSNRAHGLERYVFGAQANVQTRIWEYLASDDTWKTLQGVTDASNDITVVPPSQPTQYAVRWIVPSDWANKTLSTTLVDNSVVSTTGFWLRLRTTAVSNFAPTASPLLRTRVKMFGSANVSGIRIVEARVIRRVTVTRIGTIIGTGITTLELINFETGSAVSFDVPASPLLPYNVDVSFPLSANDVYGLAQIAGTRTITDVEMIIQ